MNKKNKIILSVILILLGIAGRLFEHPWNFTPIVAIALFSSVYLGKNYSFGIIFLSMIISDMFIGFYSAGLMLVVYFSYFLIPFLGILIKKYKNYKTILSMSLLSAIFFFLTTNFAVWLFSPWYSKNIEGLATCYFYALPFFKNSLLGNVFYSTAIFGTFELALLLKKNKNILIKLTNTDLKNTY